MKWYKCYIFMRFSFDPQKSKRLKANPKRGIGFEEAQSLFSNDEEGEVLHLVTPWKATSEEVRLYEENS